MTGRILRQKSSKSKPAKPEKPYDDFPLTAHASGKWCKKVRGRIHYFGSWDDPDRALNEWLDVRDELMAGRDPADRASNGDDVATLCNEFLSAKTQQLEDGDLAQVTYDNYEKACDRFVDYFGKGRVISSIRTADFTRYRASWPDTWGPVRINNEIARISTCLNFAYESEIVDKPIRTGSNFKRVNKKKLRLLRASKPKKLFRAEEIHQLVDASDVQMKAMILLGLNAAYGNADCGRLTKSMIDFDRCWLEGLRVKTAIERAAWLWPETITAINDAVEQKYPNAPDALSDHVFITKRRQLWYRDTGKDDAITAAFSKVRTKALITPEVKRLIESGDKRIKAEKTVKARWHGVNFYALRHTFETIGGNAKDQIAINFVMGHADDSMAAVYREGIDEQRIIDVCSFVRDWWLAGKPKKKRGAK